MRDANPGGGQGHRWPADGTTRWSRRVLRAIAWLIPAGRREACLEEWEAELWQLRTGDVGVTPAAVFLAGLTIHGLWEWKEGWRMESIVQDVRFAVRTLTRSPGFALAAILMLATSIGASTALFSVLEKAVLADPPFPEPQRLVVVDQLFGHTPEEMNASRWSYPRFKDLAEEVGSLQAVGGYRARTMTLSEMGDPAVVSVEVITPSLLPMLGVTPRLGRAFGPDEEDDGAPAMTALVSHGFWQSRFGGSPDAVGAVLTLDGLRMQVVGVLPADFAGVTGGVDIWVPMSALREIGDPGYLEDPWNLHFHVIGRLKPEATVESVRAELQSLAARMSDRYPAPEGASNLIASADVLSYREARTNPRARASMLALFGAVLLVLLMATANLAGLVMARGATRVREAAVRASLGAARSRLVRQFMTESLILALVGGVAGIVLAGFGVNLLGTWLSNALGTTGGRELQYLNPEAQGIDWTVVAFAGILTACVGVAFGLLPAWQGARADPNTAMRGGRTQTLGNRWSALPLGRNGLIAVQVALAMVLLTGATVMMNGLRSLQDVSLGYDRDNLFTALYSLSPADELAGIEPGGFHTTFLERIRAIPGVDRATLGEVPMGGPTWRNLVLSSEGRPDLTPATHSWVRIQPVADGHLEALGIELVAGRGIEATDDLNSEPVVVLNELAAQEYFPDGAALGRSIRIAWPEFEIEGARVVGITKDVQLGEVGAPAERQAYVSIRQAPRLGTGVMIRSTRSTADLAQTVRGALTAMNPNTALTSVMSMENRLATVTARPRVVTAVLGIFGSVALFLVAAGLYGTIAFTVVRRTRELGLRMSLGAEGSTVLGLVLRQSLAVTLLGLGLGVAVALILARALEGVAFGNEPLTLVDLLASSAVLFAVALAAAGIPARRALSIDPMVALRTD
jgi:predicted permease